jgi:hypothetical protein
MRIILTTLSILILGGMNRGTEPAASERGEPELQVPGAIAQTYVPGWYSHGRRVLQMPPTILPTTDPDGSPVLVPDIMPPRDLNDRINRLLLQP